LIFLQNFDFYTVIVI